MANLRPEDAGRLSPRHTMPPRVPGGSLIEEVAVAERLELPALPGSSRAALLDDRTRALLRRR